MSVQFTADAERERVEKRSLTWDYFNTQNYEEAIARAVEMGWKQRFVQVRLETHEEQVTYFVEPFERDCSCPNILKYELHVHESPIEPV